MLTGRGRGRAIGGRVPATPVPIQQPQSVATRPRSLPLPREGTLGRRLMLKANHFKVDIPEGNVYHYDVDIRSARTTKEDPATASVRTTGQKPKGLPPRLNPQLSRRIFDLLTKKHMYDPSRAYWPAYDGNRNMYTRNRLPISQPITFTLSILTKPDDPDTLEKFDVTIKPTVKAETGDCAVSLEPLHQLMEGRPCDLPMEAITALDVILRHGPSLKSVPIGYNFYRKPHTADEIVLEEGRAIWFGYHQSLRPGWKPLPGGSAVDFYLNVHKTATTFLRPMNMIDFSLELLHLKPPAPPVLTQEQGAMLRRKLKDILVKVTHLPYPRQYRVIRIVPKSSEKITFDWEEQNVTLKEYFLQRYNLRLRYPNYPCLHVGNPTKYTYLPLEVCEVADRQPSRGKLSPLQSAAMIKYTAVPPEVSFRETICSVRNTIDDNKEVLRDFGIKISTEPLTVGGRVLTAPLVSYKNGGTAVNDGRWNTKGKMFNKPAPLHRWVLLNLGRATVSAMDNFAQKLFIIGRSLGVEVAKPLKSESKKIVPAEVKKIFETYKVVNEGLQLILVIIPSNSTDMYREIKFQGEAIVGVLTQCATDENVQKCMQDRFYSQYLTNLCFKINGKLEGINQSLPEAQKSPVLQEPVIIIGADISHPSPGNREGYSIAACVANLDSFPARYISKVGIQKPGREARSRESKILELNLFVRDLLKEFYKHTNHKPRKIVFFREGLSESQFLTSLDFEMNLIRQACTSLQKDYQPGITYIAVQRRHHTRFAPLNPTEGLRNGNIPPGTVVDTSVVNPENFNYFLCSHAGLQGTSRPAHYTVLWDDNDFTADTLQKFTYHLCHTYNRCNTSVSAPPPVLYAGLAASRAKLHLEGRLGNLDEASSSSGETELDVSVSIQEDIASKMYFI